MNETNQLIELAKKARSLEESLMLSEANLKIAREELEKQLREKAAQSIKNDQALQTEILERKEVEREALEIAQKEQRRFGSQLHDGLCQELTSILMFTKALIQQTEKENDIEMAQFKKIADMLLKAVDQARDTARGLYPGEMEGASLMHSLEELLTRTHINSQVDCRFNCPETILINDNNIATHLYRITQEGVSNALKHGKAKLIEVDLIRKNNRITLIVRDDGVGFAYPVLNSKGIGLSIMKYRADMMDATFQVAANVPHGVVLTCSLKESL